MQVATHNLKPGSVVRQEYKQRAFEVTAGQQILKMISEVIVGPLQTVIATVRVLVLKQKRKLEPRRIRF